MGLTVLDAGIVIALLDGADAHHGAARRVLGEVRSDGDEMVLPASALAEALVHPARRGPDAMAVVTAFVDEMPVHVQPLDREIARTAAIIRATHGRLKLPDALVVATAQALDATRLVTTDRGWPTRSKLGLRAVLTVIRPTSG